MKRTFDVLASAIGLSLTAPLLAFIAVAIWLEDRYNPFYLGKRCARGGGLFRMVKFRSMVPNAWKTGVSSTSATDQRITRVGRLIRKAKLDELPQLWNVLIGDMSFVGPRPQVEADALLYTAEERRLLTIRPGITDAASIVFADEGEILAGSADPDLRYNQVIRPWKSRLGLLYVDHHKLATDLRLIGLTLLAAISRKRALTGVGKLLDQWDASHELLQIARRQDPLYPWAPPGSEQIVQHYPHSDAHA